MHQLSVQREDKQGKKKPRNPLARNWDNLSSDTMVDKKPRQLEKPKNIDSLPHPNIKEPIDKENEIEEHTPKLDAPMKEISNSSHMKLPLAW